MQPLSDPLAVISNHSLRASIQAYLAFADASNAEDEAGQASEASTPPRLHDDE